VSGFLAKPDTSFTHTISSLQRKCRECQVSTTGETCGEFEEMAHRDRDADNALIIRDLNDAAS
jgi:hypothetical protein